MLIITILLIASPNVGKKHHFLSILLAVFFINGGYKLVISGFKSNQNQSDSNSSKLIRKIDFSLFALQMNNIAVATFIYFLYIHVIVMANAFENPSPRLPHESFRVEVIFNGIG